MTDNPFSDNPYEPTIVAELVPTKRRTTVSDILWLIASFILFFFGLWLFIYTGWL
jgi:hypothetical protein